MIRHSQVVCKAATNASGDIPGSAPTGMTQYERIIELLTTLFPVWVCIASILCGILSSFYVSILHNLVSIRIILTEGEVDLFKSSSFCRSYWVPSLASINLLR